MTQSLFEKLFGNGSSYNQQQEQLTRLAEETRRIHHAITPSPSSKQLAR